jgi:predicted nucleic acid-binding protein
MSYSVVLDAGAFIAFEKKNRVMVRLAEAMVGDRAHMITSAGVIAQIWRDPKKQGALAYLIRHVNSVDITTPLARVLGRMLAVSRTSDPIDAHVVQLARLHGAQILTSDPRDIQKLDPSVQFRLV